MDLSPYNFNSSQSTETWRNYQMPFRWKQIHQRHSFHSFDIHFKRSHLMTTSLIFSLSVASVLFGPCTAAPAGVPPQVGRQEPQQDTNQSILLTTRCQGKLVDRDVVVNLTNRCQLYHFNDNQMSRTNFEISLTNRSQIQLQFLVPPS